jgi:DNA helicase-2/ATP-dependent DNA helicase PcrA
VFIVGLNEGTLPHFRSFEDHEAMQEECRLLYVGITRAENQLYLLHTHNRYTYGFSEPAEPSRFLIDIPTQIVEGGMSGYTSGYPSPLKFRPEKWESPVESLVVEKIYDPGMKVEHSVWGDGLVLTSKIEDDDEIVDIFFESVGLKRIVASIAKLVIKT